MIRVSCSWAMEYSPFGFFFYRFDSIFIVSIKIVVPGTRVTYRGAFFWLGGGLEGGSRHPGEEDLQRPQLVGWVLLLYVHRNRRLIRDGCPGRPPRLSHSSWAWPQFSRPLGFSPVAPPPKTSGVNKQHNVWSNSRFGLHKHCFQ